MKTPVFSGPRLASLAGGRAKGAAAVLTAAALLAAGLAAPAAAHASARPGPASPLPVPAQKPVPVRAVPVRAVTRPVMRPQRLAPAAWPAVGSAVANVAAAGASAPSGGLPTALPGPLAVRAGNLPVWVGPAAQTVRAGHDVTGRVRVTMGSQAAARAAGVHGVILSLGRASAGPAGRLHVSVSYAGFAEAYGGDYASRLRLVALPACALTTPGVPSCRRQVPVGSAEDAKALTVGADVAIPAAAPGGSLAVSAQPAASVLALSSAPTGGEGDYTATPLEQSGKWAQGGGSGAFTYSYPVQVPPVPGGLTPKISLDYSSQTVDGMTSTTNNQASWIGDGWDYSPGYVQRDYASCGQVSSELTAAKQTDPIPATAAGNLCWSGDDVTTLVLNGKSTNLVQDSSGAWHPQADGGERVQYLTGTANGTRSGGYWVITEPDGTSYYFGVNDLPNWVTGDTSTQAAENVQVYGVKSTDPCYNATWTSSVCATTWRWQLAYETDPHGNAVDYFYSDEGNAYTSDTSSTTANDSYTKGGGISKIYYGLRAGTYYGSTAGTLATAAGEVAFGTSTARTDVPTDLACTSGSSCSQYSPTFWSKYELDSITTYSLQGSTSPALKEVDLWQLGHANNATDPDPNATAPLWLGSVTRKGEDGTETALPAIQLTGKYLSNRVEPSSGDNYPTVSRERVTTIVNETGDQVNVGYDTPPGACSGTGTFPSPDANTGLCYPDWWNTGTASGTVESWFNKYVVTGVTEHNTAGGGVAVSTSYCYGGTGSAGGASCLSGGAWHHNDNPLSLSKQRTWDQWRGFGEVTTQTGTSPDPVTETQDTYFQGMDGDTLAAGGTASVKVTPSQGTAIADSSQFAGMGLEHVVCDGAAANASNGFCGDEVSDAISIPWTSAATATQTLTGLPSLQAFMTGTKEAQTFTPGTAAGGTRESDVTYTHDSSGRVSSVSNVPDTSDSSLDTCTTTSYASNTTAWILDLPAEVTRVSVPCGTTPQLPGNAVSDDLFFYNGATSLGSDTPTSGDVTETERATSYTGSTPQYTVESTAAYDQYGRVQSSTDADGRTTATAYAPATGQEPTTVTVNTPTTQNGTTATTTELTTTTTYDPARDLPLTVKDPAGYVTTETYDALGRLTAVWKPGDPTGGPATDKFSYVVSSSAPSVTTTQVLNPAGGYQTSETLYDSMGRVLQTQDETADGNRLVSDVQYNSDGWKLLVSNPYYTTGGPSAGQVTPASDNQVPSQTGYLYDGDGRVTAQIAYKFASETWETDTSYGGDYTTVTYQNKVSGEPDGGTPQTTFTNGEGLTAKVWQYHDGVTPSVNAKSGNYDQTSYAYTPAQQLAGITDARGNTWTYTYDLSGNRTAESDPDTGTTSSTYDPAGQLLSVTDARSDQVSYTYDADGRKTAEYDTTGGAAETTADKLASWAYDTLKKGLPTSSTAYYSGASYTRQVSGYNGFGQPTGTATSIPSAFGGSLTGSWSQSYSYNNYTGQESAYQDNADGGLPAEDVGIGYDAAGHPNSLTSPAWSYAGSLSYTEYGQPHEYTMGTTATPAWITDSYDAQTGLLSQSQMQTGTTPVTVDSTTYSRDNTGQLTSEADTQDGTAAQVRCYTYDYLGRLQTSWSQSAASCAAGASQAAEATAAAGYWDQYQYDTAGDLTQATATPPSGSATVTAYTYNQVLSQQTQPYQPPHGIATETVTGASAGSATYSYDLAGHLQSASGAAAPGGGQTLTWDDAGRLSRAAVGGSTVTYLYDAGGSLLLQEDTPAHGDATTTLYLGDEQVTQDTTAGIVSATRYYRLGGATIAARTSGGSVSYLDADVQGTATVAVDASSLAVTRRYYDPYGNPVGTSPSWPGTRGYAGGTTDLASTLTNLGAREYQPAAGAFVSPDPVLSPYDPQSLSPYAYAHDNPATFADPTGLVCGNTADGGMCEGQTQAAVNAAAHQETIYDQNNYGPGAKSGGVGSGPSQDDWIAAAQRALQKALAQEGQYGVFAPGCSQTLNHFGACPSEAGAAGTTPQETEQAVIGAAMILLSAVPVGDILDAFLGGGADIVAGGVQAARTGLTFTTDSAGDITVSLRTAAGDEFRFSDHALQRLTERGVSLDQASTLLGDSSKSFPYFHDDVWKLGFYNPSSRLFIGTVDGDVTTVIGKASQNYINNLMAAQP
jgi:RHS repeat-associated protein